MARYSTDVIGVSGFGVDCDHLKDPSSQYIQLAKRMLSSTARDGLVAFMKWTSPMLYNSTNYWHIEVEREIVSLVKSCMQERCYKPSSRRDFIDLLLELKEDVMAEAADELLKEENVNEITERVELKMDELLMVAQAFMFFAAGFETTASVTGFVLYQLALHPEKQTRCQQEIDEVLARHQGQLSYKAVKEMKYLQMCFKESLRLLPPTGFLIRKCVKPYKFPGTEDSSWDRCSI
ncbi:cytochrome P450 9e2-like isoform X4 [Leguminivora glycinivorella]|uniref:cytochrome P450 9e2-like isoform X4 n=1 Tax=Leguminivora glycinivorella TaxID=1035111 RepID=UPI00200C34D4|nr:cytochrome P450 9e2-like isoform X4 [Leguminivora glycinivorella]